MVNLLEVHTKDNRYMKFSFAPSEAEECTLFYNILHRSAFVDIVDTFGRSTLHKLQITFPFCHKI